MAERLRARIPVVRMPAETGREKNISVSPVASAGYYPAELRAYVTVYDGYFLIDVSNLYEILSAIGFLQPTRLSTPHPVCAVTRFVVHPKTI